MPVKYFDVQTGQNRDMLPKAGTYALLCFNKSEKRLNIGKLGKFIFKRGYYTYTGSALGMGGLRSRVYRHLKQDKSKHWHMDFLRESVSILEIWCLYGNERMECRWASIFGRADDYSIPVKGFGSSDCKCGSHLFYSKKRPLFHNIFL